MRAQFSFLVVVVFFASFAALASATVAVAKPSAKFNLEHEHVPGELIVKFRGSGDKTAAGVGAKEKAVFASGARLLSFPEKSDLFAVARQLAADPAVEYVEANTILHAFTVPNDPRFGETYGMHNTGQSGGAVDADIDAVEAWDFEKGTRETLVGVIDTGIDRSHPDLAANMWTNPGESGLDSAGADKQTNGVDDDNNGFVDDWRGWDFVNNDNDPFDDNMHGTHCAGTIGAVGDNGIGVAGVAWEVSLVGIKFLSGSGSGSLADAVKAIDYATRIGVDLTSNSWGGGGFSQALLDSIRAAEQADILFIAAAGNSALNNDTALTYPASYDSENIIAVAATDHSDALASFSNYGESKVHLAAPGVDVLSTTPGASYQTLSGTSMATPHVAGAAALLRGRFRSEPYVKIKARLVNSIDEIPSLAGKVASGGRLNIAQAVQVLPDNDPPGEVRSLQLIEAGVYTLKVNFTAPSDAPGDTPERLRYFARYSVAPITDEASWREAKRASLQVIATSGTTLTASVTAIQGGFRGYLTVRAVDQMGNVGVIGTSLPFTLEEPSVLIDNKGVMTEGMVMEPRWGFERCSDDWSDSCFAAAVRRQYEPDEDSSLIFPETAIRKNNYIIEYDIQPNMQGEGRLSLEIRTSRDTRWREVKRYTGFRPMYRDRVSLTQFIRTGSTFVQVRFHFVAAGSSWWGPVVDNILLQAE
jgi:subtilisin family serine protease